MTDSPLASLPAVRGYLARIGGELRSLRRAVTSERVGAYWRDTGHVRFLDGGGVEASSDAIAPTEAEAVAIASEMAAIEMPRSVPAPSPDGLPDGIVESDSVFRFHDRGGNLAMVQVRMERKDGGKTYMPWSYWSDGRWRHAEPEGKLPLWGLDAVDGHETVFVHEGAKAARAGRRIAEGEAEGAHPWQDELGHAAHVGWIGGALNPRRTDWTPLRETGAKRIYIVADNDWAGLSATRRISREIDWDCIVMAIEFSDSFPPGFDLADPFPERMFVRHDGIRYYTGPTFHQCRHPATWATRKVETGGKGRPSYTLREGFRKLWAYVDSADVFVCREMPEIVRGERVLNRMLARHSDVDNTARLIVRSQGRRAVRLAYRPDTERVAIEDGESSAINLHVPSRIRPREGDPAPWIDFMRYLVLRDDERAETMRWCATLIARPGTRIGYGLLMVSETQGVGKTTLGGCVLAPLVGMHNTSFPGEQSLLSPFNEWVANKRLAVVNEIYTGASWKAYHNLKSAMTDKHVEVNVKYQRQYVSENWCHVFACSNSLRALKIDDTDRRWFYPELTEKPWPERRFAEFRQWLERGGLQIVRHWADTFGDYVTPGAVAPMTERKRDLIDDSRSVAQSEAARLGNIVAEAEAPVFVSSRGLRQWVTGQVGKEVYDSDLELRKAFAGAHGIRVHGRRVKIDGQHQHILMNTSGFRALDGEKAADIKAERAFLRKMVKHPNDLLDTDM